ncbi:endonuclease [Bacillus sp. FJAT-27251]|uniref:endonuclease I family protein n=1 Tax=Bacillus sp. FJAT-27251 TaxID=1684142 RepID=UPI000840AEE6|nr:endonuclease [Bacillus sp. FJAT-27251]
MALDGNDLYSVLVLLEDTREKLKHLKEYYDEKKDQELANAYYSEIDLHTDPAGLFRNLNKLLADTHVNQLPYNAATRNSLYSIVDLREDGNLKSIYSGKVRDPAQVIKEDYEAEANRRNMISMLDDESFDTLDFMYNCEHVVPQSWFHKKNPMRGDLHHLFTCEKDCNSLRSNHPYFDFDDYTPVMEANVIKSQCGKYEEGRFEPESGKGEAARATLYFLLRYPKEISHYSSGGIDIMLHWHTEHPVTNFEKRRNMEIHQIQQNRNPLIDFPELAGKIDFSLSIEENGE